MAKRYIKRERECVCLFDLVFSNDVRTYFTHIYIFFKKKECFVEHKFPLFRSKRRRSTTLLAMLLLAKKNSRKQKRSTSKQWHCRSGDEDVPSNYLLPPQRKIEIVTEKRLEFESWFFDS